MSVALASSYLLRRNWQVDFRFFVSAVSYILNECGIGLLVFIVAAQLAQPIS